jgi:hypothetical protein
MTEPRIRVWSISYRVEVITAAHGFNNLRLIGESKREIVYNTTVIADYDLDLTTYAGFYNAMGNLSRAYGNSQNILLYHFQELSEVPEEYYEKFKQQIDTARRNNGDAGLN